MKQKPQRINLSQELIALAGPNAGGTPLLSEPTVWSARTFKHLDDMSVYKAAFTNANYENEARVGGTVNIARLDGGTVTDYTGTWPDSDWQELTDEQAVLQITEAKKFLLKVRKIRQDFNPINLMDEGSKAAARKMAPVIDSFIASSFADISATNDYGNDAAPITVGLGAGETKPSLALDMLYEKLDDAGAPDDGGLRVVVPSWFRTMLSQEIGTRQTLMGDKAKQGEYAGKGLFATDISGFDAIYASKRVPNTAGTKFKVMAGTNAITFAMGLEEMTIIPELQNDFASGLKALWAYGKKLPDAKYMALGTFDKGSYA